MGAALGRQQGEEGGEPGGRRGRGDRVEEVGGGAAELFSERKRRARGTPEMTPELKELIRRWSLTTQDVRFLYRRFRELDADGSGALDVDEFFAQVDGRTLFLETMFKMLVGNISELDFALWAHVVLTFCLSTRQEMVERVFMAFDDGDGFIDIGELHDLLVALHSENPIFPSEIVSSLTELCLSQEGKLDFDDLMRADSQHPMLLWPVFRTVHRMRKRTLGYRFCERIDQRLAETSHHDGHREHLVRKWRKRTEEIMLACCGWAWCRREEELRPTPLIEIEARKRALRRLRQNQVRRVVNPSGALFRYRPLPTGAHHAQTDDLIERDVFQAFVKPIRDSELRMPPPTLTALDEDGNNFELSTSGSDSGDLVEYGRDDEYPDLVAFGRERARARLHKAKA